jgi:3-oxoacyl-[acyl-carrier protein] reductase
MSITNGVNELDSAWFREIYVDHGKLPLRRPAAPDEVAKAVSYLVSAGNTYCTGQRMVVDGGLTVTF